MARLKIGAELSIFDLAAAHAPEVHAECVRVARRLIHSGRRVIGFLPASEAVAVPPVAVQVGLALADVANRKVAFVDANLRWPGLARVIGQESPPSGDSVYRTRWVGKLAVLTPTHPGQAGGGVLELARVLTRGEAKYSHVLADLTGFDRLGEHLDAVDLVDGVVLVGRSGETSEEELLRLTEQLRAPNQLGILLVGGLGPS